jgi:hypothetical protein
MSDEPGQELEPIAREPVRRRRSAAEKIQATLRALSKPSPDAEPMELTIATMCMGLERSLGEQLRQSQGSSDVDDFVGALTRFLATHRSDTARRLVVVEMPRAPEGMRLPNGTRLRLLDEAEALAEQAPSPL